MVALCECGAETLCHVELLKAQDVLDQVVWDYCDAYAEVIRLQAELNSLKELE